jgi:hypothetical protein
VEALKKAFPDDTPLFYSHVYLHDNESHKSLRKLAYNDAHPGQVPDFISVVFDRLKKRFTE